MLNLKKTAVAVLAFGSSAVFAGSMGPVCSAVNVTVPCEATAWDFGAKALYLKPSMSGDHGFGSAIAATSGNLTAVDITADHAPDYNWGFQIEGSYHFSTGKDLNVNWYHVSRSNTNTYAALPTANFNILGNAETLTLLGGTSTINPKWDAVNIEVGQHVDFGDNKVIRFHGGAQYARLANSFSRANSLTTSLLEGTYEYATTFNPTFNGFGPRVGMDMNLDWGNGLAIYANGATALLAGTRSYNATFVDSLGGTGLNAVAFNSSRTAIVPAIDAKLGATYTYAMAQGDLTLDAGWMFVDYISAHRNIDGNDTDFGLQGPYIGLKWMGNVA